MTRVTIGLVAALAAAVVLAGQAAGTPRGSFEYRGVVTRVVDGDTIDVRLTDDTRVRVRLLGIDAAERGACFAVQATARARELALSKRVLLRGDPSQATRDRYGRLLAYVWVPGGRDLGYQLLAGGFARVYVHGRPFQRLAAYRHAESLAKRRGAGSWRSCGGVIRPLAPVAPVAPAPSPGCHPGYSPCLPVVADLDCADVRRLGVAPVRVLGSDPYRLDGDDDGVGCE